jgi:uncharacterized protein (DUF58 family)
MLQLASRRLAGARRRGRRTSRRIGAGSELVDTRPYVLGDDPRRIAWSAFARLEKLLVRLLADEAPLRLALVVDTSASMRYGASPPGHTRILTKLRQAARIAAGLAAVALVGEDRACIAATSDRDVTAMRAVGGRAGLPRILAMLDSLHAAGNTDLARAAHAVTRAAGGPALCVILSDFFDDAGALSGARALRAQGHDVALVEVLAPFEIDPPWIDAAELEDEETGEIVALAEAGAAEAYRAALAAHREAMDVEAGDMGALVLRVTTAEPFDAIVQSALIAGLLRAGKGG